jgi:hypothetical protein
VQGVSRAPPTIEGIGLFSLFPHEIDAVEYQVHVAPERRIGILKHNFAECSAVFGYLLGQYMNTERVRLSM